MGSGDVLGLGLGHKEEDRPGSLRGLGTGPVHFSLIFNLRRSDLVVGKARSPVWDSGQPDPTLARAWAGPQLSSGGIS